MEDYEKKLKHFCKKEGFDLIETPCPRCHYENLLEKGTEPSLAAKTAFHKYIGLPLDDKAREHYLKGFFEMRKKKHDETVKPTVIFVDEDSLTREEFEELWYDLWGFCDCGKPGVVCEFIKDTLHHLGEVPKCLEDNRYEDAFENLKKYKELIQYSSSTGLSHFSLYALTTMGLIKHKKSLIESTLTPQGKLFLNFLKREKIDMLFDIE